MSQGFSEITVRIPNLPIGAITDDKGNPTQNEQLFRQALIDLLNTYLGPEGIVAPPQPPVNVTTIQNAKSFTGSATCLPGTIIYEQHPTDYTQDKLVVAFRTSNTEGVPPLFKIVTVT